MRLLTTNACLRLIAAFSFVAFVGGCSPAIEPSVNVVVRPDGTLDPGTRQKRVDRVLRVVGTIAETASELVADKRYPALTVGVVLDGNLIWWAGYGSKRLGRSELVSADTVFRIASVTKTVTGLAVLKLRDEGRLELDAPATRYLPELARVIPPSTGSPKITLRHLITHTSGMPRVGGIDYASRADKDLSAAELIGVLDGLKLETSPGTRTKYSNLGMGLVGQIISRVSGVPFTQYMQREILARIGMTSTFWRPESVPAKRMATGYTRTKEGGFAPRHHWRIGAGAAMGGLYSTLKDLGRYAAFQMDAWPPRSTPDRGPIRRSSVRETHRVAGYGRPGHSVFGVNWGSGTLGKDLMISHTGSTWQYASCVRVLPERGVAVGALASAGDSKHLARLARAALKDMTEALSEKGLSLSRVSIVPLLTPAR